MYDDSFWEIGRDYMTGLPVIFNERENGTLIVYAFDLTPRMETECWIVDIPPEAFWPIWTAARKEYGNGCA